MSLVIFNGVQYDDQALPAHIPADQCVPIDEWFRMNRKAAGPPKVQSAKPSPGKRSRKAAGPPKVQSAKPSPGADVED